MRFTIILLITLVSSAVFAQNKSGGSGRYQVLQLSNMRRDQVMIDTQTGKIWHSTCLVSSGDECAYEAWLMDEVEGVTKSRAELYKAADKREKLIKEVQQLKETESKK